MAQKTVNPYQNIPYLPLENTDQDTRHGAHFFRNVKQLQVGFGSKVFRVDRDGMWAGAENFADAPFSVDWDGNVIANSLDLSGYLQVGQALSDIGAGNITGTYIANGAIVSDKIAANAVTATKISVSELSAISANIGSVTAGTLTGTLVRTSSSGKRVQMSNSTNDLRVYDSSGELRMALDDDLLQFYDEGGATSGSIFASSTGSYDYLYISNSTTDGAIVMEIDNTGYFAIGEDANPRFYYLPSSNTWVIEHDLYPESDGAADLGGSGFRWDTVYCYALDEVSDINLKENIMPISYGLKEVLKMEPIMYNFKGNQEHEGHNASIKDDLKKNFDKRMKKKMKGMTKAEKDAFLAKKDARTQETDQRKVERLSKLKSKVHIGFSAQDMYKIVPEITRGASPDSTETASINKTQLIPVLVRAIQELHEEIEMLKKGKK